jgi:hypothetical protein
MTNLPENVSNDNSLRPALNGIVGILMMMSDDRSAQAQFAASRSWRVDAPGTVYGRPFLLVSRIGIKAANSYRDYPT